MTIRELLLSQLRRLMLVGFGCWLAFAVAGIAGSSGYVPTWVAFIPFVGFGGTILSLLFRVRCPRCGGRLGQMAALLNPKWRAFNRPVNFCPYCGVSLEEPVAVSSNYRMERP